MNGQNGNGKNYKLNHIKVFGSTEGFYKSVKNYRRVYDAAESTYIYAEISFLNKLVGEEDWTARIQFVCTDTKTGNEICRLNKDIAVKSSQATVVTDQGWGTKEVGWWQKGYYKWDIYLNEDYVGSSYFYIMDLGVVTAENNPYFNIQHIRFFESAVDFTRIEDRKYLQAFNASTARYVNVELKLHLLTSVRPLPLDLTFRIYNAKRQHKSTSLYFKEWSDKGDFLTLDFGYGSNNGDYWREGAHVVEVEFMNELVAVAPFYIGNQEVPMKEEVSFEPEYFGDEVTARASSDSDYHYNTQLPAKSNFKFEYLKVFGSTERYFGNQKRHRIVFDVSECSYLYGELSFINKQYDEKDWSCKARFVCTDVTTGKEICNLDHQLDVKKEDYKRKTDQGWGTEKTGWWKKGKYKWDAYLDEQYQGSTYFYVVDVGQITADNNPYVKINNLRLFESDVQGTPIAERRYLETFKRGSTRYVNMEVDLDILTEERPLPLDIKFKYYNAKGQHKCTAFYFKDVTDNKKQLIFDTGYGAPSGNYWYSGDYIIEMLLMDELVAIIPFSVGPDEVVMKDSLFMAVHGAHNPDISANEKLVKGGGFSFTKKLLNYISSNKTDKQ